MGHYTPTVMGYIRGLDVLCCVLVLSSHRAGMSSVTRCQVACTKGCQKKLVTAQFVPLLGLWLWDVDVANMLSPSFVPFSE